MNKYVRPTVYSILIVLAGVVLACNIAPFRVEGETPSAAPLDVVGATEPGQPSLAPVAPSQFRALSAAWQPAGFGGAGNFDGVFFDPQQPGVVYAASDVTGVFRSADNGDHWEMRSVGLGNYEVSSFAVDPFDSNTLYAGAGALSSSRKAGIYVSHDAGLTWQHLTSTFTHTITFRRYRTINAIAPDPAHPGYFLSGSRENGLWRTTDSGDTWTQVYAAPLTNAPLFSTYDDDPADPHPAPVAMVVFHPLVSSTVYAALDGFGVISSTDSGENWTPANAGLPASATVKYLAVGSNAVLYAAAGEDGVYRSDDGGDQWQEVNGFPPTVTLNADAWVSSVAVHPDDSDTAYLTLTTYHHPSVWKTSNGGVTWATTGNVSVDPLNDPTEAWSVNFPGDFYWPYTLSWQVTLDPHDPNRLFYVHYWDVVRSEDAGAHWTNRIVGAQNTCVTALAEDEGTLYATHWDAGLLASTNRGVTWTAVLPSTVNDSALAGHYWRVAIARTGNTKYYYTTSDTWSYEHNYGQVLRSTDGISWTVVFTNPRPAGTWMGGQMLGLAVDPATPSTLYVLQDGGQVWKSVNNGDDWATTTGQPGGNSFTFALAVNAAGRIFAGTLNDGLRRSTNGGDSWEQVLTDQATIFDLLAVSNTVYAAAGDANLYRSTDGGDAWEPLTSVSTVDDGDDVGDQGMAIAVDPQNPDHIFFGRRDTWHNADAGVVESTDGGETWMPINEGLRHLSISALTVSTAGDLYAGTACGGIWRRLVSTTTLTPSVYLPLVLSNLQSAPTWWQPPVTTTWQWQLSDLPVVQSFDVDMYDIDLFDNDASTVAALHTQGRKVVCYISVGSWEDWRSDADQFPPAVLGNDYAGWPGEKWLDIRQIALLAPIMRARFDQCQAKGFDGIEPDNIDGYTNDTGFPLTYQDQLNYNIWLANETHARGLSIGLKNDDEQVHDLLSYFDWALTEDCFADEWCSEMTPFINVGKAVFAAEYTDMMNTNEFLTNVCPQAQTIQFSTILKHRDLDTWLLTCP
jgi:hypothetical protein